MPLPVEFPDSDKVTTRAELISFLQGLKNAIYRDEHAYEQQLSRTGQAHADTNHKMLDAIAGLSAWLDDYFDPGNPQRLEEPGDPEVWRWIAIAFHAAATYE